MKQAHAAYVETLRYLGGLGHFGVRLGTENIARLLHRLGDPHKAYPVFHVAGTNGKGSTAHALAAILRAAGLRVGLYTSPHLLRLTERIVVGGQEIDKDALAQIAARVREEAGDLPLTFFEVVTAIGFEYFAKSGVDAAVVEVGLGGRLDATNVVEPLISLITTIGLEHREHLGATIAEIAREKAGVIKGGRPVILGDMSAVAQRTIEGIAQERGSPVHAFGREYSALREAPSAEGERFWFRGKTLGGRYMTPLRGHYQVANAAMAAYAAELAAGFGFPIEEKHVAEGLVVAHVHGRMMQVADEPTVVLDVAHNPPAMRALSAALSDRYGPRPMAFVVGMLEDKDHLETLGAIAPHAMALWAVRPDSPRARDPQDLVTAARELGMRAYPEDAFEKALAAARAEVGPAGVVVVTGSFYTLTAAMRALGLGGEPDPIPLGDPLRAAPVAAV